MQYIYVHKCIICSYMHIYDTSKVGVIPIAAADIFFKKMTLLLDNFIQ